MQLLLHLYTFTKLERMFRTNLGSDGICQQCLGAYLAVVVKKVFIYTLFIRNHNFVPASKQHLTG